MNDLITISDMKEYDQLLALKKCMIAFGVSWSVPCQSQYKVLSDFVGKYAYPREIAKVDIEEHPDLGQNNNIQVVPTIVLFNKGGEIKRLVGLQYLDNIHRLLQSTDSNVTKEEKETMPFCINHPDRQTNYLCLKHEIHLCEECLACRDPEIYCKFRSSCIIWFKTKKIRGLEEVETEGAK